jgi:hypothetical protein
MLPLIAVPVIHSSGAWLASTAAGGYVASTLSSTWIGAFIAGNAGILSGLGITSAAGVLAAMGGGLSSVGAALGSGLTAIGLGGVAQSLGLAPATFLGLTVVGWAIAGASVAAAGVGYFFTRGKLADINDERAKGGIAAVTWSQIIAEAREFEKQAMIGILEELQAETEIIIVHCAIEEAVINGNSYKISDLKYVIEKNGREYVALRSKIPFRPIILFVVKEENK